MKIKSLVFLLAILFGFATTQSASARDYRRPSCGHDYYHRECSRCVRHCSHDRDWRYSGNRYRSDDSYRYGDSSRYGINGYRERVIYYYQSYDSRWYCPERRFYIRCR